MDRPQYFSGDREIIYLSDKVLFGYELKKKEQREYDLHCHNDYEIFYFMDGEIDSLVEGQKYVPAPGSFLLIPPHALHCVRVLSDKTCRHFSLRFHPELLSTERRGLLLASFPKPEEKVRRRIYYENGEDYHISSFFEAVCACGEMEEKMREELLPICIEALLAQILCMSDNGEQKSERTADNMLDILYYLNSHLRERVSLDEFSERFLISKHHLNKVFREATGTTVYDYLLRKRVAAAQQMLINGTSTQDACMLSGFQDYSAFYRAYCRILGHSPGKDKGQLSALTSSGSPETQMETAEAE